MVGSEGNTWKEVTAQPVSGQAHTGPRMQFGATSLDFTPLGKQRSAMPTIRDLVSAIRRRNGVDAALILGRDGLLIDGATDPALDPDSLAAHVPSLVQAAIEMGTAAGRGEFALMVQEYSAGTLVITAVSPHAFLLVVLRPDGDLAELVYDLRRFRAQIAALV